MEDMIIASLIDPARAVESAMELEHAGVDELHFAYKGEQDIATIKAVADAVDLPLCIQISPERFEDVKKVLYAGGTSVCLHTEKEEVRKEVLGRFGSEKVYGMIKEGSVKNMDNVGKQLATYGYGRIYVMAEGTVREAAEGLSSVFRDYPVIVQTLEGQEDFHALGGFIKSSGVSGILVSAACGRRAGEIKQAFLAEGLPVKTAGSAIPFSEFKLNEDGLIPAVVQDYKTGQVLMMAYMNEAAFQQTIETGRMTYYSRSRKELWLKGETSGHYQYVKELRLDCDKDTILAKVEQIGAACHTGSYSCFFRNLVKKDYREENPLTILKEDYEVIAHRKEHPKEGSYTNYLFDKGIDKILKKIGEEATEIVIAAKNPEREELKYEISDFLYHMMVLMVEQGLTWEDITEELAKRR